MYKYVNAELIEMAKWYLNLNNWSSPPAFGNRYGTSAELAGSTLPAHASFARNLKLLLSNCGALNMRAKQALPDDDGLKPGMRDKMRQTLETDDPDHPVAVVPSAC